VQPMIANFSPTSGQVGTVVTVNGSGFSGANLAWVGAAHNGAVRVVSDTQVQVTIPSGSTTGAIGIFNPKFAAFTPTAFTVR
jgi:endoglucanase